MATKPYKYVGPEDRHTEQGILLKRGDVVQLDETRAYNLRDRFERVADDAFVAASNPDPDDTDLNSDSDDSDE